MNDLEIRQLHYFLETAALLKVKRTAKKLGVSQPAVTRQIQQIEERVGMTLFRRSSSGLKLTPRGDEFLKRAQAFVNEYKQSIQHSKAVHRSTSGCVVVGLDVGVFLGCPHIGNQMNAFEKLFPPFDIEPVDVFPAEAFERLVTRDIDLLMTMQSCPEEFADRFEEEIVCRTDVRIIVHSDHPFTSMKSVDIRQLDGVPLVMLDEDSQPGFAEELAADFERDGSRMRIVQHASSETSLLTYVKTGFGVAILHCSSECPTTDELRAIDVTGLASDASRHVRLFWRKDESYSALDAFRKHIAPKRRKR